MSRLDTQLTNPATKRFEWKGNTGSLTYYNKETKENVQVELPFGFLVLDRVFTIGGGHKVDGKWSGYWSNAVQDLKTQPFFVNSKEGEIAKGFYSNIKGQKNMKCVTGLYIAYIDDDAVTKIGYLKLSGAAMSEWIDIARKLNIYSGAFALTGSTTQTNGGTTYQAPTFKHKADITDESDAVAKELAVHVVEYLKAYFKKANDVSTEIDDDELPTHSGGQTEAEWDPTDDDAPEGLDSLPF